MCNFYLDRFLRMNYYNSGFFMKIIFFSALSFLILTSLYSAKAPAGTFQGRIVYVNSSELILKSGKKEKTVFLSAETEIYNIEGDISDISELWINKTASVKFDKKTGKASEIRITGIITDKSVKKTVQTENDAAGKDSSADKKL